MTRFLGKWALRLHGGVLLVMMPFLVYESSIGLLQGTGSFAFLHANAVADVGLSQLYFVMIIVAFFLLFGSFQGVLWVWNLLGCLVQAVPFASNFVFAKLYSNSGIAPSWPLHGTLIMLELAALMAAAYGMAKHPNGNR